MCSPPPGPFQDIEGPSPPVPRTYPTGKSASPRRMDRSAPFARGPSTMRGASPAPRRSLSARCPGPGTSRCARATTRKCSRMTSAAHGDSRRPRLSGPLRLTSSRSAPRWWRAAGRQAAQRRQGPTKDQRCMPEQRETERQAHIQEAPRSATTHTHNGAAWRLGQKSQGTYKQADAKAAPGNIR